MDLVKRIKEYKRKPKWSDGLDIYLKYTHRNLPQVRIKLVKVDIPNKRDWDRLNHEIDMILKVKLQSKGYNAEQIKVEREVVKIVEATVEAVVEKQIQEKRTKKVRKGNDLDEAYTQLKNLYTRRAKLTNKLKDPGDDKNLIAINIAILDQIAPIMDTMKEVEAKIQRLKQPIIEAAIPPDLKVVIARDRNYTVKMLMEMADAEISSLRKKIRDDISKTKKQLKSTVITQNTRDRNERKLIQREREWEALLKIIEERNAANT